MRRPASLFYNVWDDTSVLDLTAAAGSYCDFHLIFFQAYKHFVDFPQESALTFLQICRSVSVYLIRKICYNKITIIRCSQPEKKG